MWGYFAISGLVAGGNNRRWNTIGSQVACLNMFRVKGVNVESPIVNAQRLARIGAGAVLARALSLVFGLATSQMVKSHMKFKKKSKETTTT
jgi:hydroxymethylglutaryl-CoA reductase